MQTVASIITILIAVPVIVHMARSLFDELTGQR